MKYLGKGLARSGFSVFGMQLAGHCGSDADLLATGWQDWISSVETAYDWLRQRVDRVLVGGLSMGALLALELETRRPGAVAGLALYSTTIWYDGWNVPLRQLEFLLPLVLRLPFGKRFRWSEAFPYGIKDERVRRRVVAQMHAGNSAGAGLPCLTGPSLRELTTLIARIKRNIGQVRAPALIVHAIEDDVTGPRNARFLERNLGGPASVVWLDDCYHMITVDRQRDTVIEKTTDFFAAIARENPVAQGSAAE
jgi:carboxylesterase